MAERTTNCGEEAGDCKIGKARRTEFIAEFACPDDHHLLHGSMGSWIHGFMDSWMMDDGSERRPTLMCGGVNP